MSGSGVPLSPAPSIQEAIVERSVHYLVEDRLYSYQVPRADIRNLSKVPDTTDIFAE